MVERAGGVRSLERGIAVLIALNRLRRASVLDLAAATALPRPTIYRMLEALRAAGLVARDEATERWRVTQRARALSDGYDEEDWVGALARPVLHALGRDVAWPVSLFTLDAGRMLVRETTHSQSVLSIDHGMVGQRLPLLRTAAGRAYLAYCPARERAALLLMLAGSDAEEDRLVGPPARLAGVLRRVRKDGFGIQVREYNPRTASISVPIPTAAGVLGCISLIWIASALTVEEAAARYLARLRDAASRIAGGVEPPRG